MKIVLDGKEIPVRDSYAALAKYSVDSLLRIASKDKTSNEALYLTTLLIMYQRSTELLNELGVDNIKYILESAAEDKH